MVYAQTDGPMGLGTPQFKKKICLKNLDPKMVRTDGWTNGTWRTSTLKKILPQKFGLHNGVQTDGWTGGTWHASIFQ